MVRYPLAWLFVLLLCTCVRAQKSNWDSIRFFRLDSLITENGWQDSLSGKRVDTLERLLDRLPGPRYRATYALRRGVQLRRAGSSVAGREYLEAAIAGFRTVADSANIAKATYNLARTYLAEGNYERAFALYEDALYRYRNLGDVRMEINALESLGVTLRRTEQPDRALEYYEKAYDRARALEDRDLTVGALINRAIVHKRKNEFSRAIDLYLEGLTLVSRPPADPRQTAYLNLNLSSCYSAMNRYEAALDYAERAYAWFVLSGSARERSMNLVGLAVNYNKVGQQELTVETAREALRIVGDETGLSATIHETMADAFTAMNRADSASHHLKTATNVKLKLAEEKRTSALDKLESEFENREKQREIERLEAEEAANARRLRNRGIIIGVTLLGVLALSWLLLRNQRQRRLIESQHGTITRALGEKELLLKEIHHRVKNNLQMVSSLLNMQTRYVEDKVAADALQLGRSRVRSMALIHQKLYVGDEVATVVDAKDYLERLVQEIVGTHAPAESNVQLQIDVEPLEMDVDTMVPLGLLTNEAVTNAVKYAFVGRNQGRLKVRLWQREDQYTLTIVDDGPGMRSTSVGKESFGQLLMTTLAEQLEGTLEVKDTGEGVSVVLRF